MPQATATVNGVEVARSSTWEVVDGNIYVRDTFILQDSTPLTNNPIVPSLLYYKVPLHTHIHDHALPLQRRRKLLHRHRQQNRGSRLGVVLPGAH
jgi:hypothetical protein